MNIRTGTVYYIHLGINLSAPRRRLSLVLKANGKVVVIDKFLIIRLRGPINQFGSRRGFDEECPCVTQRIVKEEK